MLYPLEPSFINAFYFHIDRVAHYDPLVAELEAKVSAAQARGSKAEEIAALHVAKERHANN
jgi:hypothetical protein